MSGLGLPGDARLRGSARRRARPDTRTALVAGSLLIAATVASLLSTRLLNPVFSGSDYLLKIAANQDRIVAGAFFQIVAAFAERGIALSLYPVVEKTRRGPGGRFGRLPPPRGSAVSRRGHRHTSVAPGGPGCSGRIPDPVVSIWLLVRGFHSSSTVPASVRPVARMDGDIEPGLESLSVTAPTRAE